MKPRQRKLWREETPQTALAHLINRRTMELKALKGLQKALAKKKMSTEEQFAWLNLITRL